MAIKKRLNLKSRLNPKASKPVVEVEEEIIEEEELDEIEEVVEDFQSDEPNDIDEDDEELDKELEEELETDDDEEVEEEEEVKAVKKKIIKKAPVETKTKVKPKATVPAKKATADDLSSELHNALGWGTRAKRPERIFEAGERLTKEELTKRFKQRLDESNFPLPTLAAAEKLLSIFEEFLLESVTNNSLQFMGKMFTHKLQKTVIRRPPTRDEDFLVPEHSLVSWRSKVGQFYDPIEGRVKEDGSFEAGIFKDKGFEPNQEQQKIVDLLMK